MGGGADGWIGMIVSVELMDLTELSVTYSNPESDSDVGERPGGPGMAGAPTDGDGALDLKEKFLSDSLH